MAEKKGIKNYFGSVFSFDKSEISSLNGIRAILIFILFFGHMYSMAGDSGKMVGVDPLLKNFSRNVTFILDIFFVLSGFLISAPLFKELRKNNTLNLKFFYIRRTLRIFPPYYMFLIFQTFFIIALSKMVTSPEQKDLANKMLDAIVYDYLYLSNYFQGIMLHGWSLSLEEQFYIFFPFFLMVIFRYIPERFRLSSLFVLYFIPLIYRFYIYYNYLLPNAGHSGGIYESMIYKPFQGHADSIFAGIILAYVIEHKKEWLDFVIHETILGKIIHISAWVILLSYNIFLYELDTSIFTNVLRFNVINIVTVIIVLYSMRPGFANNFFSMKIFSPIAKLSYLAYLLHMLLLGYLMYPLSQKKEIFFSDIMLYWIPFSFVIFFFSYLFHLISEKPFMILKDKLTSKYKKEAISRL